MRTQLAEAGATIGSWAKGIDEATSMRAYLVALILTATAWLLHGNLFGAASGGLLFGLLTSTDQFVSSRWMWLRNAGQSGWLLFLVLYFWKSSRLMPLEWEPTRYNDAVGVGACFLMYFLAFSYGSIRDTTLSQERPNVAAAGSERDAQQYALQTGWHTPMVLAAVVVGILGLTLNVALLKPTWISTPDAALSRYVSKSIFDFKSKENLSYALASSTSVRLLSKSEDEDRVTYKLEVSVPVVPFELDQDQARSFSAQRRYFDLPSEDRPFAVFKLDVLLQRTGFGWEVVNGAFMSDPVVLSRAYRLGALTIAKKTPEFGLVGFTGLLDFASRPFNPMFLITMLLVSTMLAIGKPQVALVGCIIAIMPTVLSIACLFFLP